MVAKIIKESLKTADDGYVEVTLQDENTTVKGFIAETFFEEAFGKTTLNQQQKVRFTQDNLSYLESTFQKLLEDNTAELVIR